MSYVNLDITPEELLNSATALKNKLNSFHGAYTSIYAATSDLKVSYKGEASTTFNQRIEGYRNDFEAADKALNAFIEELKTYAGKARDTENDINGKASRLSNGK